MRQIFLTSTIFFLSFLFLGCSDGSNETEDIISDGDIEISTVYDDQDAKVIKDMLTPQYYEMKSSSFRDEVNKFIHFAQNIKFHHPLKDSSGVIPDYSTPAQGDFPAEKNGFQNHPAVDMHVGNKESIVNIHAAHDGFIRVFRDAEKYRHYISVENEILDEDGVLLGRLVTLYAHLDLSEPVVSEGDYVTQGDLIEKILYEGTVGGPHLHFETRYYRADDEGTEEFYGGRTGDTIISPSLNGFLGYWDPDIGYGYGDPANHGIDH